MFGQLWVLEVAAHSLSTRYCSGDGLNVTIGYSLVNCIHLFVDVCVKMKTTSSLIYSVEIIFGNQPVASFIDLTYLLPIYLGAKVHTLSDDWKAATKDYMKFQKMNPISGISSKGDH